MERVVSTEECPSISDKVLKSIPDSMHDVANECRNIWKLLTGILYLFKYCSGGSVLSQYSNSPLSIVDNVFA